MRLALLDNAMNNIVCGARGLVQSISPARRRVPPLRPPNSNVLLLGKSSLTPPQGLTKPISCSAFHVYMSGNFPEIHTVHIIQLGRCNVLLNSTGHHMGRNNIFTSSNLFPVYLYNKSFKEVAGQRFVLLSQCT